ncbi:uncharacterized protein MYCFIDRAFT_212111 [Pseudocercospora fijiensis CIRAD86]|uniref:Uncharacterized protein n=1 Tax=Pseudocercospora fijiensis (strain CIRAD86) TaxID=383855 RepID=M3ANG7_PSEFD|nr:uncharacterized protein MYCFIDRAFT_212111 [Pseudocercospora fijiensis CIRAD86]EME79017.1 hypothetical protein MYCFIDRAFT_212111 [Pseudocercospora fijiensis CIRAD86]
MSTSTHRPKKQYIDPEMAVTIDDVREGRMPPLEKLNMESAVTYVDPNSNPASTTYQCESTGSWVIPGRRHSRGRSPVSSRRRRSSPYGRTVSSATSFTQESPTRRYAFDDEDSCSEAADIKPLERKSTSETLMEETAGTSAPAGSANVESATALATSKAPVLRRRDTWPSREFLHTDSGFDETMIEDIERGRPSTPLEQGSTHSDYHTPATHYNGDATHSDTTTLMNYDREGAGIPGLQDGAMALGKEVEDF